MKIEKTNVRSIGNSLNGSSEIQNEVKNNFELFLLGIGETRNVLL